jgi:hypothetical protein
MSAINGDKSRFNRERKQRIRRRMRNRVLLRTPEAAASQTSESKKPEARVRVKE